MDPKNPPSRPVGAEAPEGALAATIEAARAPVPSVGRIVHYTPGPADRWQGTLAALVTRVWGATSDACVNLTVFYPDGSTAPVSSAARGDAPGQWNWPPRVG